MKCPFCGDQESKVVDSRHSEDGLSIRRRRECMNCQRRFTTYEIVESLPIIVVKRDGSRQSFDRNKILNSMVRAFDKRQVEMAELDRITTEIEQDVQNTLEREVTTDKLGEMVLESMRTFVAAAGPLGPVVFLLLQIAQVVLPFIPGGVTLTTGVLAFGPWFGFLLNYAGVVAGSIINFYMARRYGHRLVLHLVDEKTWQKYIGRLDNSRGFTRFFALAILLPFFPDDTLCLLAGLTNMRADVFTVILLVGKPLTIAVYSAIYLYAGSLLAFAG